MNLGKIIEAFREEIRDTKKPYLVSDTLAKRYANQAESQVARRSRLIVDSTTDGVAIVGYTANDPIVQIDPRIISIRRARLRSGSNPLLKRKVRDMDCELRGWDSSSNTSTPFVIVVDYESNVLRLYPTPSADGELMMTVTVEPLVEMESISDTPTIAPRNHDGMINWMKFRAYSNNDLDLYSPENAAKALVLFEQEFGELSGSINEQYEFENYDDLGER